MPYYLHQHDTTIHGTIIVIDANPETSPKEIQVSDAPIIDSAGNPVKTKTGWTLGPVSTQNEAQAVALAIAKVFNWDIEIDGRLLRLPVEYIDRRNAASAMGSARSAKKSAAVAENGKKGGRPRKQKPA